jgi:Coenzyme PQQ synthesis protein D (PqqD)
VTPAAFLGKITGSFRFLTSAYQKPHPTGVMRMVEFENRTVVPRHVLVRHLEGESVLLNLQTERYFGLDTTGTRMWEQLASSPSIEEAYEKLLEEFEVEPGLLRANLSELLTNLVQNGLLNVEPADVGTTPSV